MFSQIKISLLSLATLCAAVIGLILLATPTHASSADFVSTWDTRITNRNSSNSNQLTMPANSVEIYDYTIDWGDGTTDNNITGAITHTYDTPGVYVVRISGTFPRIYFNNEGDKDKILSVDQWGTINWSSFDNAFAGARNVEILATDAPDLRGVKSLSAAFLGATSLNQSINHWDVSTIENLSMTFKGATSFNQPLNNWDTSNVKNLQGTFHGAIRFNQPLSNWQVGKVGIFTDMFAFAVNFDQPLSSWNMASAFNIAGMFYNARNFDQDISAWDLNNILYAHYLFNGVRMSTENYDSFLIALSNNGQTERPRNIRFSGGLSTYCAAATARGQLEQLWGWVITDSGEDCETTNTPPTTPVNQSYIVASTDDLNVQGDYLFIQLGCEIDVRDARLFRVSSADLIATQELVFSQPSDSNLDNVYDLCFSVMRENGAIDEINAELRVLSDNTYRLVRLTPASSSGQSDASQTGVLAVSNDNTSGGNANEEQAKVLGATGSAWVLLNAIGVLIIAAVFGIRHLTARKRNF